MRGYKALEQDFMSVAPATQTKLLEQEKRRCEQEQQQPEEPLHARCARRVRRRLAQGPLPAIEGPCSCSRRRVQVREKDLGAEMAGHMLQGVAVEKLVRIEANVDQPSALLWQSCVRTMTGRESTTLLENRDFLRTLAHLCGQLLQTASVPPTSAA
eukprot:gnl/TRDRNA2_/TRDRNA2_167201_c1_seq2.p1 gnl/TRDRNA2_/TRDRNA2_167201_c1~~gnl/TRDRNA2_/TRDRNA2_167201_c1_seq2.p1  ORF type:complete len:156 (-),score=26.98 gnl/TRDRNA2_/TRDRNA2_167201_c1_seq2:108-575(-)